MELAAVHSRTRSAMVNSSRESSSKRNRSKAKANVAAASLEAGAVVEVVVEATRMPPTLSRTSLLPLTVED